MSTSTCSDGRDHWTSRPRGRGAVQAVVACAVRSRCIVLPKVGMRDVRGFDTSRASVRQNTTLLSRLWSCLPAGPYSCSFRFSRGALRGGGRAAPSRFSSTGVT